MGKCTLSVFEGPTEGNVCLMEANNGAGSTLPPHKTSLRVCGCAALKLIFFEKEVGTPGLCIIVMPTTIFIKIDVRQQGQNHQQVKYIMKATTAEPLSLRNTVDLKLMVVSCCVTQLI